MNRWEKSKAPANGTVWDTTQALPIVTTASGTEYVIWPAIWTYLVRRPAFAFLPPPPRRLLDF